MHTILIYVDTTSNAEKIKEALKLFRGVTKISEKLSIEDIEYLADSKLSDEIDKAKKSDTLSFNEAKKEIAKIKAKLAG
ncbi:MAG: hypothetical protein KJ607_09720 [Bacteroidetes bacterium]|nr:hypothetical protein [Bacteroidota bacterium]